MFRSKISPPVIVSRMGPKGVAVCDGCGLVVPYQSMSAQFDYRGGNSPVPTGLRVCTGCYDTPNEQLRLQVFKPDPVPFRNPRPDTADNTNILTETELVLVTQDDDNIIWT